MITGIETQAARAAGSVVASMASRAITVRQERQLRDAIRGLTPIRSADALGSELGLEAAAALDSYLGSPDFEHITTQMVLALRRRTERDRAELREVLRLSLRNTVPVGPEQLFAITDVVFDALTVACGAALGALESVGGRLEETTVAAQAHVAAMAARNSRLLERVTDVSAFLEPARLLRAQVATLHGVIRLPHAGVSRSVPWSALYVEPALVSDRVEDPPQSAANLTRPGRRTVVLGDAGSGKSTLAAHIAYTVATEPAPRVPFLLVLRDIAAALRDGERSVLDHVRRVAHSPYHVELPADAAEYFMLNGRAVVIFDGLDELGDPSLRGQAASLVEGFVTRYPLVPVVVTSRVVGYDAAPLSRDLFGVCRLAPFDDEQVTAYATKWFQHDESQPPQERDQLVQSFIRDSGPIGGLRGNPLLLSLLCAMYTYERYIPRNLAQVYERCAVLAFERWDSLRGLQRMPRFHTYLRGAVQELAWQMLAASGSAYVGKRRAEQIVSRYLRSRRFDEDDADATAQEFLDFCAQRSWVLIEAGMGSGEAVYGFAHRTFLEFFAAEHLVRHHPSAEAVWERLAPVVSDPNWSVVAQLAIQLLDRNVQDGAEALLECAFADYATGSQDRRAAIAALLANACGHIGLAPPTLARILDAALDCVGGDSVEQRFHFWITAEHSARARTTDGPLQALMSDCLDANLPYVRDALKHRFEAGIAAGDELTLFMIHNLGRYGDASDGLRAGYWDGLEVELVEQHRDVFEDWWRRRPWGLLWGDPGPSLLIDFIDATNLASLYMSDTYFSGYTSPTAPRLLFDADGNIDHSGAARLLAQRLVEIPTPWIPAEQWRRDLAARGEPDAWVLGFVHRDPGPHPADLAAHLVLCLPYLEMESKDPTARFEAPHTSTLVNARRHGTGALLPPGCPPRLADFVTRWARSELSVIG